MSLEALSKLIEEGETDEARELAGKLLADGQDPLQMIEHLTRTMARVGDLFARLEIFLPEIMLAGEAPIARSTLSDLATIPEFIDLTIYRTDGTNAFHDNATIDRRRFRCFRAALSCSFTDRFS